AAPFLRQPDVADGDRRERPRIRERLRQRRGVALQRPDAGLDDAHRYLRAVETSPGVPRAPGIVEQPRRLLRRIELEVQRATGRLRDVVRLDAPQHRPPRLEVLDDDVDGGRVEDPEELA